MRSFRIFNFPSVCKKISQIKEEKYSRKNNVKIETQKMKQCRSSKQWKKNLRVMILCNKFSLHRALLNWKNERSARIYVLVKFKYTYLLVHLPASSWAWKRRIRKGTIGILIENLVVADGIPRRSSRNRVWGGLSALFLDTYTQPRHTGGHKRSQNTKEEASSNSCLLLLSKRIN